MHAIVKFRDDTAEDVVGSRTRIFPRCHLSWPRSLTLLALDDPPVQAENTDTPFKKIMAANRGEIAVRITRAGLELGLQTLAVYSEADRLQPHRFKADESYQVGSKDMTPVQCYLDYVGIVKLAKKQGVDVIHPGYGFLSENANFARECAENGITFVGPLPETIDAMGDKTAARKMAEACEVPVVQGTNEPILSSEEAKAFSGEIGYPVMIKARSGGGGRGMRVVRGEE